MLVAALAPAAVLEAVPVAAELGVVTVAAVPVVAVVAAAVVVVVVVGPANSDHRSRADAIPITRWKQLACDA